MPPKHLIDREFHWKQVILLPFRVVQVSIVTVLMLIWNFLFGGAENYIESCDPQRHTWRPPRPATATTPGDARSPCPALNTLANHGFLPRDGRNIRPHTFIHALQRGYNLSYPLAAFLTWGSFILLEQWGRVSLGDLARHGCVEHNASLGHGDALDGAEYAPTSSDAEYIQRLLDESTDGMGLRLKDMARARVRREAEYPIPLDGLHAEIARGEMGLVLAVFGRWVPTSPVDKGRESPAPLSPTISAPTRPATPTPAHSREPSGDTSADLTPSSSRFPTSASMGSSQATLVDPAPPAPTKPSLSAALDTLKSTLTAPLVRPLLAPPSKTLLTPGPAPDSPPQETALELSLPLSIAKLWWTREQLPAGFRTASIYVPTRAPSALFADLSAAPPGAAERAALDVDGDGAYGLKTVKEGGVVPAAAGRAGSRETTFLEVVQLSLGIKAVMRDMRREGI